MWWRSSRESEPAGGDKRPGVWCRNSLFLPQIEVSNFEQIQVRVNP